MTHPHPDETSPEQNLHPGFEETMPIPQDEAQQGQAPVPPEDTVPAGNQRTPAESGDLGPPPPVPPDAEGPGKKPKGRRPFWLYSTLFGVFALILVAALSAFTGYRSGINLRQAAEATQAASYAEQQYAMALQDIENKQYNRARQRLEYIIAVNPNYPGAAEQLAEVLLAANTTATPTAAPTPTVTPTPDMRGVEELFSQAEQSLLNSDWTTTIDTLLTLRKTDPQYRPIEIDGMLFLAFRNRGKDKILKEADLEGGIYDLSLAERFGPLDTEAVSFRTWARIYITGASFWEVDWGQVVYYFEQVAPQLPNLRDGSGWTATERYRLALIGYGDTLMQKEEWCEAQAKYELALSLGPDAEAEEAFDDARKNCSGESDEDEDDNEEEAAAPPATEAPPAATTEAAPETPPEVTSEPPTQAPPTETQAPPPATTEPPPAASEEPAVETTAPSS